MKKNNRFLPVDLIFIFSACMFFLSCVYTTLQTARTKEPGQGEVSGGYMQLRSIEEFSEDPVQLIGINGRLGVATNFDAGLAHTFDISKDSEGIGNTLWGDVKYQFTNKENNNYKPVLSSGLIKGYIYDSDVQGHMTSLPLYFSVPIKRFTPTFMYRYRLSSDGFIPNSDSEDNHLFAIGVEYYLKEPDNTQWIPKVALSVGTLQNFEVWGDDSGTFLINFGFKVDSPFGNR